MNDDRIGYWYEHINGTIIFKPRIVVESAGVLNYFDSPFVKRWWFGTREVLTIKPDPIVSATIAAPKIIPAECITPTLTPLQHWLEWFKSGQQS